MLWRAEIVNVWSRRRFHTVTRDSNAADNYPWAYQRGYKAASSLSHSGVYHVSCFSSIRPVFGAKHLLLLQVGPPCKHDWRQSGDLRENRPSVCNYLFLLQPVTIEEIEWVSKRLSALYLGLGLATCVFNLLNLAAVHSTNQSSLNSASKRFVSTKSINSLLTSSKDMTMPDSFNCSCAYAIQAGCATTNIVSPKIKNLSCSDPRALAGFGKPITADNGRRYTNA